MAGVYVEADASLLQFGHDTNAVDAGAGDKAYAYLDGLQFGHDTNAVDAARLAVLHVRRASGFNSATTPMPWMPHQSGGQKPPGGRRFNSATTPMPWMPQRAVA